MLHDGWDDGLALDPPFTGRAALIVTAVAVSCGAVLVGAAAASVQWLWMQRRR